MLIAGLMRLNTWHTHADVFNAHQYEKLPAWALTACMRGLCLLWPNGRRAAGMLQAGRKLLHLHPFKLISLDWLPS